MAASIQNAPDALALQTGFLAEWFLRRASLRDAVVVVVVARGMMGRVCVSRRSLHRSYLKGSTRISPRLHCPRSCACCASRYGADATYEVEARVKDVSGDAFAAILQRLESNTVRTRPMSHPRTHAGSTVRWDVDRRQRGHTRPAKKHLVSYSLPPSVVTRRGGTVAPPSRQSTRTSRATYERRGHLARCVEQRAPAALVEGAPGS